MNLRLAFCLSSLLLPWAGCGSTTSLDVCHAGCEKQRRCDKAQADKVQACHDECERDRARYLAEDEADARACKNAQERLKRHLDCLQMECTQIASCTMQIENVCVPLQ
jgi:hypothetical protein